MVFFSLLILTSCNLIDENYFEVSINKDLEFDLKLFKDSEKYKVKIKGGENYILGEIIEGNSTKFVPIIPFTKGETYEVYYDENLVGEFTIKFNDEVQNPKLLTIFPETDTVPENLLKMYVVFSKQMQEVKSAKDFITVTDNTNGKEIDVFLDLETELWNANQTELTLWLDPGRIKKDLIPNKTLGKPIEQGKSYTITFDKNWFDADGNKLEKIYTKEIFVKEKDVEKPNLNQFKIITPKVNTKEKLIVKSSDFLDMMLIEKNVRILYNDKNVSGDFSYSKNSKDFYFQPKDNWISGEYTISIKSKLEDLAGNNFNRLFDRDITKDEKENLKERFLMFNIQ